MKEKIAKWYKQGLWSETMVRNAVSKGVISVEDAADILTPQVTEIERVYIEDEHQYSGLLEDE